MVQNISVLGRESQDFRLFTAVFAFSFLCHVTILFLAGYLPGKMVSKRRVPSIINVSLASLPLQQLSRELPGKPNAKPHAKPKTPPAVVKEKPPVEKAVLPKVEPKKEEPKEVLEPPEPKEKVIIKSEEAPAPKPKTSMKKQTYEPSKVLEKAREKLEKEVDASSQNILSERIRALQKEVGDAEEEETYSDEEGEEGPGNTESMGVPGGAQGMSLEDTYLNIVAFQIQKNWNFSEQLARGGKGLIVAIIFKIMPDGEIRDIWIEKRSGNAFLDESAMKAIEKSSPVQPHPAGIIKSYITGALEFTPSGIQ